MDWACPHQEGELADTNREKINCLLSPPSFEDGDEPGSVSALYLASCESSSCQ